MEFTTKVSFDDTKAAFYYKTDRELKKARFIFSVVNVPWLSRLAQKVAVWSLRLHLPVVGLIRETVYSHFCAGETAGDAEDTIRNLADVNMNVILNYAVEGGQSASGYEQTVSETLKCIDIAATHPNVPFCVLKVTGICSAALLEKKQRNELFSGEEEREWNVFQSYLGKIASAAAAKGVALLIDGEETWLQEPIDESAQTLMRIHNRKMPVIYITFQLYLKSGLDHLRSAIETARREGYILGAKLVRGAYMEQERERADEGGYPSPIQETKEATDHDFNEALKVCVANHPHVALMCGSHNENSNLFMLQCIEEQGLKDSDQHFWFAQLYGMSDNISFNLARAGCNVAKYLPYGPVRSVMPYLIRRAQENTSVAHQSNRELQLIRKELKRRKQK